MNVIQLTAPLVLAAIVVPPALADRNVDRVRQPPDPLIGLEIRDELQSRFRLDQPDIKARVIAGKVTLEGKVSSFRDRMEVERQIKQVDGVRHVHNRLRIKRWAYDSEPLRHLNHVDKLSLNEVKNFRGRIQWKGTDEMIVSVFDEGPVEVNLNDSSDVILDGKQVDDDMLGLGILVSVEATKDQGKLIAQTVDAYSPR